MAFLAVCDPPSTQRINGLFNSTGQSKDPRDEALVRVVCRGSGSSSPLRQTFSSPRASGFLLTTEGQLCKSSNPFVPPWRQCPSVGRWLSDWLAGQGGIVDPLWKTRWSKERVASVCELLHRTDRQTGRFSRGSTHTHTHLTNWRSHSSKVQEPAGGWLADRPSYLTPICLRPSGHTTDLAQAPSEPRDRRSESTPRHHYSSTPLSSLHPHHTDTHTPPQIRSWPDRVTNMTRREIGTRYLAPGTSTWWNQWVTREKDRYRCLLSLSGSRFTQEKHLNS